MSKSKLNRAEVELLRGLKVCPDGLTREQINLRGLSTVGLGTLKDMREGGDPTSLVSRGYVKVELQDRGNRNVAMYYATQRGINLADSIEIQDTSMGGEQDRVPSRNLDAAAKKFMPTRAYGLERYTEEDLKELRDLLPEAYRKVPLEALREQVIARRKSGAYKVEVQFPEWYTEYQRSEHWQNFSAAMLIDSEGACSLNAEHREGVEVYHRRYQREGVSVLWKEEFNDVTCLCKRCFTASWRRMQLPPAQEPGTHSEE